MNGYPSKAELKAIKKFEGTPREFVEYVGSIWRNGAGWSLEEVDSGWGDRKEWLVRFITGGWSGCEEVIGVVSKTLFGFSFHSKWERGGLWEYRISAALIDSEGEWGTQYRKPASSRTSSGSES